MKSALLLNASPMQADARGHNLARAATRNLRVAHPALSVTARDLSRGDFGWIGPDYAGAIVGRAEHDSPAFRQSEVLISELERSDALIISTPMHNYTVPAVLKLWIDLVVRAGRSFGFRDGRKVGLLADRPTLIIVSSGGAVRLGATQPDHLTGYLTDVLATIGIRDLHFLYLEALARPESAAHSLAQGRRALDADDSFGVALPRTVQFGG